MQALINRAYTRTRRIVVGVKLVYAVGGSDAFMEMTRSLSERCTPKAHGREIIQQFSQFARHAITVIPDIRRGRIRHAENSTRSRNPGIILGAVQRRIVLNHARRQESYPQDDSREKVEIRINSATRQSGFPFRHRTSLSLSLSLSTGSQRASIRLSRVRGA